MTTAPSNIRNVSITYFPHGGGVNTGQLVTVASRAVTERKSHAGTVAARTQDRCRSGAGPLPAGRSPSRDPALGGVYASDGGCAITDGDQH